MSKIKRTVNVLTNIPKETAKASIRVYQKTLSFDHSFWARPDVYRVCIHEPSCSEYTYQAIDRFGLVKGGTMGFFRILRCNPWSDGGHDPVPEKFSIKKNVKSI